MGKVRRTKKSAEGRMSLAFFASIGAVVYVAAFLYWAITADKEIVTWQWVFGASVPASLAAFAAFLYLRDRNTTWRFR